MSIECQKGQSRVGEPYIANTIYCLARQYIVLAIYGSPTLLCPFWHSIDTSHRYGSGVVLGMTSLWLWIYTYWLYILSLFLFMEIIFSLCNGDVSTIMFQMAHKHISLFYGIVIRNEIRLLISGHTVNRTSWSFLPASFCVLMLSCNAFLPRWRYESRKEHST